MKSKLILVAVVVEFLALALFGYQLVTSIFGLDGFEVSWEVHELIEVVSVLGLLVGFIMALVLLSNSNKRNIRVEEQLKVASHAFQGLLEEKFDIWGLTASEREIALLIIKGFSISEISNLRGNSEGTIKAHNSAIYTKSGLSGRVQFVSYFLEELTAEL